MGPFPFLVGGDGGRQCQKGLEQLLSLALLFGDEHISDGSAVRQCCLSPWDYLPRILSRHFIPHPCSPPCFLGHPPTWEHTGVSMDTHTDSR